MTEDHRTVLYTRRVGTKKKRGGGEEEGDEVSANGDTAVGCRSTVADTPYSPFFFSYLRAARCRQIRTARECEERTRQQQKGGNNATETTKERKTDKSQQQQHQK
jgi:hypothetical protein